MLESLLDVHRIIFWISFLLIRNESRGRRASGKAVYGRDREEWCCTAPALLYRKASRLWMPYGRMGDIYISINMEESGVYTRHKLQMKQQAKMHADDASIIWSNYSILLSTFLIPVFSVFQTGEQDSNPKLETTTPAGTVLSRRCTPLTSFGLFWQGEVLAGIHGAVHICSFGLFWRGRWGSCRHFTALYAYIVSAFFDGVDEVLAAMCALPLLIPRHGDNEKDVSGLPCQSVSTTYIPPRSFVLHGRETWGCNLSCSILQYVRQ